MTDFDRKHAHSIRASLTKTLESRKKNMAHKMGFIEAERENWRRREERSKGIFKDYSK